MTTMDAYLLKDAPLLFGIVADPEDDGHPCVVAWGHQIAEQTVTSWFVADGSCEIAVFSSAQEALETAETLYPARLMWILPTGGEQARRAPLPTPVTGPYCG